MKKISFQGKISFNDLKNKKKQVIQLDSNNDQYVRDILPLRIQNFEIRKLEWKDFNGKPNLESPWIAHCYWCNQYEYYISMDREQTTIQTQSPLRLPRMPLQPINNPLNQLNLQRGRLSSANKMKRPPTPNNNSPSRQITRSNSQSALRKQSPYRQKIKLNVRCKLQDKSWAKQKTNDLLLEHETCHYLIGCLSALEFKRKIESLDLLSNQNFREEIQQIFKANLKEFVKIEKDYDEETNHFRDQENQKAWNRKIKEQLLIYEMYFNN